jgi:flagellar L-ring protein precursor FlgH
MATAEVRREPTQQPIAPVSKPTAGSIFAPGNGQLSLFSDNRARQVGDIITVILVEKTAAKKSASTSTTKDQGVDIGVPSLAGYELSRFQASIEAGREFTGGGDTAQSNQLDGTVTVTVVERLSNGNLRIAGEKQLQINQGDETVRVAGIVRPSDISTDNSVLSSRVADAQITYKGTGALADSNAPGWVSRILNSEWFPF